MPSTFRSLIGNRNFALCWAGLVLSQVGTRATLAANLYHVFALTNSTLQTGLVGLAQGVALLACAPIGGVVADRFDRRRLLQTAQLFSLSVSTWLGVMTALGLTTRWHILLAVLLNTAGQSFEQPARQALVPSLVPKHELVEAFALVQTSNKVGMLVGPGIGGFIIAVSGPAAVYLFDAGTYLVIIVLLALIRLEVTHRARRPFFGELRGGLAYVRSKPIIYHLMAIDYLSMSFGAYRVFLPAIALDVLDVGPEGYGLLSAAPALGALLGTAAMFRLIRRVRAGRLLLLGTIGYGLTVSGLALSRAFLLSLVAALGVGVTDALAVAVRHAAVQLESPDELRGRVSSIYKIAASSGPAMGDLQMGALGAVFAPMLVLGLGGIVPVVTALAYLRFGTTVRDYNVAWTRP